MKPVTSNLACSWSLRFDMSNYKITPKDKSGRGRRLGSPKIWWLLLNIYAMAETINFKFGTQLGIAN